MNTDLTPASHAESTDEPSRPAILTRPVSRTVLLTGASGVVGTALVPALAKHRVIALTHRNGAPGTEELRGDLSAHAMGLDPQRYADVADEVDVVIHAAAMTDFTAGAEKTNALNIAGTRRMIQFAKDADATLHYVSTAFIDRAALAREEVNEAAADPSAYLASKRQAEHDVRTSGLAHTITRPSVVIGDTLTGEISQFQGLHTLALAVLRNALPLVPLVPADRIDFVPRDLVADAIAALVNAGIDRGEYWLTAGECAPTTQAVVDAAVAAGAGLGLDLIAPRLVQPDMVDRLIRPVFIDPLPERERRRFDDLTAMAALFASAGSFASDLATIPGARTTTATELLAAWEASVIYLGEKKGLGAAAPSISDRRSDVA